MVFVYKIKMDCEKTGLKTNTWHLFWLLLGNYEGENICSPIFSLSI